MDSNSTWDELDEFWEDSEFNWNDAEIIEDVINNINGGRSPIQAVDQLNDRDKRRFITLTTIVLGEEIIQRKEKKNFKLTSKDVTLTINELSKKLGVTAKLLEK